MRSGDNIRDLYYQSPYLKRLTSTMQGNFSQGKEDGEGSAKEAESSANKENMSPMSIGSGSTGGRSVGK